MKKKITRPLSLRRLAEECGLSYQSVSRILNGDISRHKSETVKKVEQVARKLGYRRNLLARGALTGRSQSVGVILPFQIDYEMNTRIAIGIQRELAGSGYMAITCTAEGTEEDICNINQFIERRVQGVIFRAHPDGVTDPLIEELRHHRVPVVSVLDNDPALEGVVDFVGSDEAQMGEMAADYLWGLGYRHFGFTRLGEMRFDHMLQRRFKAFEARLQSFGIPYSLKTTPLSAVASPDIDAIGALLDSLPRPTAIFASVDDIAYVVYRACAMRGLRIPEDVAVLGSINFRASEFLTPSLSSFDQQAEEIGRIAATCILERIRISKNTLPAERHLVHPRLVERESTQPA